jgi:LDH2 family malate/lactate/ureidoglycolate dehydrogenase
MLLSIREVPQLAGRCFAAAGFPDGTAQTNADAIWWTEAYRGSGLTTLHRLLDDLSTWDRSALSLADRASMVTTVDSSEQPSCVSAGPALDLSCSQAQQHGIGITYTSIAPDDESLPLIGHTAYRAAERGYVPIVLYTDTEKGAGTIVGTPDEPQPLIAERTFDDPSVGYVKVMDAIERGLHQYRNYPLMQAFFDREEENRYSNAETRLLDRLMRRSMEPSDRPLPTDESGFLIVCIDPLHPRYPNEVKGIVEQFIADEADEFTTVFRPEDVQERVGKMVNEGVEIEREIWDDIFEYSSGVLAPPFEGSRDDAGFGLE